MSLYRYRRNFVYKHTCLSALKFTIIYISLQILCKTTKHNFPTLFQHVAFLDIEEKKGAALETQLNAKFGALRAKFIKCDIANEDELTRAYKLVTDKYRRLDVVVNNAAVLSRDGENSGRMVDVNFVSTLVPMFL